MTDVWHPLYCRPPEPDMRWEVRLGGVTGKVGLFGETRRLENGSPKMHYGIDWLAPVGTPVFAGHDGRIQRCGEQEGGKGFGQRVYIVTGEGQNRLLTIYAHLSVQFVTLNESVRAGHCLGLVGRSGNLGTGPDHLHHEVRLGGEGRDSAVDPLWWYHERNS